MPRIYFPKIPLVLQSPASLAEMQGANTLVFRTAPAIGKVQIKNFLGAVYGLDIKVVHTVNHEGKKKFNRQTRRWYRKPDWKKAWVYLNDPIDVGFAASAATTHTPNR